MAEYAPQSLPPELLAELQRLELLRMQGKLPPVAQPQYARSANTPVGDLMAQATTPEFGRAFDQTGQFLSSVSPPQAALNASDAVATAMGKPTLPNITDAGAQTAMALMQPMKAAKILGAGFGLAGASDLFDSGVQAAQPAKSKQAAPAKSALKMPGLDDDQNARANELIDKLANSDFANGAERRAFEDELKRFRDISQGFVTRNQESENRIKEEKQRNEEAQRAAEAKRKSDEDAAARGRANAAYAEGLNTQRRFSDTTIGSMFDKFGPVAPGVVAFGTAGLSGAGMHGVKAAAQHFGKNVSPWWMHGVPVATGTVAGGVSANWPQAYEANYAPNVNPSYQAAQNYIREAPVGDPRAAQLKGLLDDGTITQENPVRKEAHRSLYDPKELAERTGYGVAEGILGGVAGGELIPAGKYLLQSAPKAAYEVSRVPGAAARGLIDGYGSVGASATGSSAASKAAGGAGQTGNTAGSVGSYARYPSTSDPTRQNIRDLYREQTLARGETLEPQTFSDAVKKGFESKNLKFPSIAGRAEVTNDAIKAFEAQYGRMPISQQEWAQFIYRNTGTLGAAGLLGAAATQSGDLMGPSY